MRKGDNFINRLKEKIIIREIKRQPEDQITVTVDRNDLPEAVRMLYYDMGGWLSTMFQMMRDN